MSRIRLFAPDDVVETDAPAILAFPAPSNGGSATTTDAVYRARVLHENRECPICNYPAIEPVELRDAALNRNRTPIPGTATLVGFRCERCEYEWPA